MGTVTVIASDNPDYWSIEVKDTGIGIPFKEQKKLFKMFFRGSNTINLKVSGSGIGLLLVKRLVKKHKGKIFVKSKPNRGSSFLIRFKHGYKHLKVGEPGKPDKTALPLPDKRLFHIPLPISNNISDIPADRPVILIVEDNEELAAYLQRSLSDKYTVFIATNGQEGLEMAKTINPQLIISDIMMPVMRGDEMCEQIKTNIETSHIPVILLSALSDREHILKGLNINADKYITKPFDIAIFKADVSSILANRALLIKRYSQLDLPKPSTDNCISELDFKFMSKVKQAIENNIDNPDYGVDMLCAELNMCRTSFYNKIKALTEQAPADFIRSRRMEKSKELLKLRKYTINDIAFMVGFNDAKYFREVFKKYFDMTPSQYIESIETNQKNEHLS